MNLILLFDDDFVDNGRRVRLTGRRFRHVLDVHRAREGEELLVGKLGGRIGHGMITSLDQESLEMEVALFHDPPDPLPVNVILAVPRPKVLSRVIACLGSMGVKKIYLVNSWRVEKSYWDSPKLDIGNLHDHLIFGLEQGRDTVLPDIEIKRFLKPFVEDELESIAHGTLRLIAHPSAGDDCPREVDGAVTLVIGPEGGFITEEIDLFRRAGFSPVTVGSRVLRVETAVPAILGRLF